MIFLDANREREKSSKSMSTLEVAQRLGFKNRANVNYMLKVNKFPNAFRENNSWRIPISDVESYERTHKVDGCLDAKQAAKRLGYKATFSIIELIEKSVLPNAFKVNSKWWIPEEDIESIEKIQSKSLDTKQVAQKLDVKSERVTEMIRNNVFPNSFKDVLGVLRIPIEDVEEFQMEKTLEEFQMKERNSESVDLAEAVKLLGYKTKGVILKYLHNNVFPNAYQYSGKKE